MKSQPRSSQASDYFEQTFSSEDISTVAYRLYKEAGAEGDPLQHWLEAEAWLRFRGTVQ